MAADNIRHSVRALRKNPGFAVAAILSLALGIGATTAIFSVINALLLTQVPYEDPDRLVILWNRSPGLGIAEDWFSTAQYFDIKGGHKGFEQVAVAIGGNVNLTGEGEPERVGGIRMSSNLLPMLGVRAATGRLFVAAEDAPGQPATAIVSHGMWARRYGSDPRLIGKVIFVGGVPHQVVGILPDSFRLPREVLPTLGGAEQCDLVLPLPLGPAAAQARDREDYNIVGKLKRGVSVRQAQAEMDTITARLRRDHADLYPPNGGLTFSIVPLLEQVVGEVRQPLYMLFAGVALVLLVACANAANLLLARAMGQQRDIAIRAAFGASRGRIVRQLLTESLLLSGCGAAVGVLFATWSVSVIQVLGLKSLPRLGDIAIDGRVLLFTVAVSILTGVVFGLVPALRVSRLDLNSALKEAGRGAAGAGAVWGRGRRTRKLLVVAELAVSVTLLVGAGLLVRSFAILQAVHPGFTPQGALTFELTMTGRKYNDRQAVLAGYQQLWQRLDALPGITASGGISAFPLTQSPSWTPITIEGRAPQPGERFINADERAVAWRYFQAMQIPLRAGRFFDERDRADSPRVAIIDERLAREYFPGQDPIGRRMTAGGPGPNAPWLTIVGVVGRVKHDSLDSDPRIAFYVPHTQLPGRALTIVMRTSGEPKALAGTVGKTVRAIDADLPLYRVRTVDAIVGESLARRRFSMLLLSVFAGFALVLASVGVYGVMGYVVSQGSREIGIRVALGATTPRILALVLRQGFLLAAIGIACGLAGAVALTRFMRSLLFGVTATDWPTFSAAPALLLVIALVATYLPARRAARIDPNVTLRCE
ncbi:MAG: ABC transporter permease [Bacteroidales bacterium]